MPNGHETKNPPPPPSPPPPGGTGPGRATPGDGTQSPPQDLLRKAAGVGGAVGGAVGGVIGGVVGALIGCCLQHLH